MKRSIPFYFLIVFSLSNFVGLSGQCQNLINNSSFEQWEHFMPKFWRITNGIPAILKADFQFQCFITDLDNQKLRSRCFNSGSDSLSYVLVAEDSMLEGELRHKLEEGVTYALFFYANKLPMMSQERRDTIAINFTPNALPKNTNPRRLGKYLKIPLINIDSIYNHVWSLVQVDFVAKGNEKYMQIGAFKNLYPKMYYPLNHLCYDDFLLVEKNKMEHSVAFNRNEHLLTQPERLKLIAYAKRIENDFDSLIINGFASKTGHSKQNIVLSKKRALEVERIIQENSNVRTSCIFSGDGVSDCTEAYQKVTIKAVLRDFKSSNRINYNKDLQVLLDTLMKRDQRFRYFDKETEVDNHVLYEKQLALDSMNRVILDSIIQEHGYPGLSMVGPDFMDVGFYIILHADNAYRKRYMPLLEKQASKCEYNYSLLPLLYDKILVEDKNLQQYGTQFYFDKEERTFKPFPIEQEESVDIRRAQYKLMPLKRYKKYMNDAEY